MLNTRVSEVLQKKYPDLLIKLSKQQTIHVYHNNHWVLLIGERKIFARHSDSIISLSVSDPEYLRFVCEIIEHEMDLINAISFL